MSQRAMERRRFQAAGDPLRFRMVSLFNMRRNWTAKELGLELRIDPNRLYYHLRILQDAGFIAVVGSQASGRVAERIYALAQNQRVVYDPSEPEERVLHLRAQLESARAAAEDAIYAQAGQVGSGERPTYLSYASPGTYTALAEDFPEFRERLQALTTEMHDRARARRGSGEVPPSGWRELSFTFVLVEKPLPEWFEQETESA